ncbi:MAG: polyketide synthase, partial [Streptosporangiaceae bacterium]
MAELSWQPPAVASVAVIGLDCRFPDAHDPPALLDTILTGRRAFRQVPPGRLSLSGRFAGTRASRPRAGLIEGWRFDRAAFRIPEHVYRAADPAHWLALETAARALAGVGCPGGRGLDRDRVGVIVGATTTDGLPLSVPAGISSYFGFRGGSQAVAGACASSLQAIASACAALAARDIDVALAGGVDLSLDPLVPAGLPGADVAAGEMRVYDENPTGYLPGEGCGVVVLMRTAQARAAGLPVYAEIIGWGTSAGARPGVVASDASSQLLALRRAYGRAGVDPRDVALIEGHGSGTAADDDAEL